MRKIVVLISTILVIAASTALAEEIREEKGSYGTDGYILYITNSEVQIRSHVYLPYQYKQNEIWAIFGTPQVSGPQSDLYIFSEAIAFIYYDNWGNSANIVLVPNALYLAL